MQAFIFIGKQKKENKRKKENMLTTSGVRSRAHIYIKYTQFQIYVETYHDVCDAVRYLSRSGMV